MILLTSVFCVVLSLEFGVATPKGNRFRQSNLQNEGNNEFNVQQNTGEPINSYNIPNNENELLYQENQKNLFMTNEDFEKMYANDKPVAFRNIKNEHYIQKGVISENKDYNRNTAERNFNNFNEESPRYSYIASLPQANRMQSFRPKDEENNEANMEARTVDILSEVNNPNNDPAPVGSKSPIDQENKSANQIINKYNRLNSQAPENFKYEEVDTSLSDVPVATPEYIKTLYNEDKLKKKHNAKPIITNSPRNVISNKNLQSNSQNVNEATFQNPSAEILYETGQAKPYEISNEPSNNSGQGHTNAHNILRDKQRLKNLYLSSKPTKNYMIVYPDGRVEQVDQLEKIQKAHPNYVMLNAKELLQHGKPNDKYVGSQGSVVKQYSSTAKNAKSQLNSIENIKDEQIEKEQQTVEEQTLPVQNELPVATESPIILTTEVTETNNVVTYSKDQLKETKRNDSQEKDKLNNNDNTNSETIVSTSDDSSNQVSTTSTSDIQDNEDIVTTVRCTQSTPPPDTVILNQNSSYPLSNNTDNPNVSKQPEDSNTTVGNLINTKDDSVPAGENTTPIPKEESKEDESTKNTTITSDPNANKENSYTTERIETFIANNETYTNSSSVDSSVNKEESNSTNASNNETVITSEDGTDSDGNTFHIETIVTKSTNDSSLANQESNNATSSESSTVVSNSNTTEIKNSSGENTENDTKPLKVTSTTLTNNTSDLQENNQNNTDTTTIQTVSNVTNADVNEPKNNDNNPKQDDAKPTNTGGAVSSNDEDSTAPGSDLKDNDPSQKVINEDDEDNNENSDTESPSSDETIKEPSYWFNADQSFWKKLMSSTDHNNFYFLFPRPKPNTKETKKIMYPNGTVVIETIETVDNGDGESNSTKTVTTCGNCTTCDKN